MIEVLNKADRLDPDTHAAAIQRAESGDSLLVSALTGEGIDTLKARLGLALQRGTNLMEIRLHPSDGQRRAWLHANGEIVSEVEEGGETRIEVRLGEQAQARWRAL
jgi:GTP-binding protein HflX